ncbi:hypothetical protein FHW16_001367 [Phyllobacterium myrsinacearum]|uniref:Uncharacterized protein n=1 Tax=Phyllobacterium myrsinacearum TaxID=28101 RepID=A0A839EHC1_9HYPH|nr:hypothetical protein [Phyllobacterium myrsinacearum]
MDHILRTPKRLQAAVSNRSAGGKAPPFALLRAWSRKIVRLFGQDHAPNIDLRMYLSARPEAGPDHARHLLAVSGAILTRFKSVRPKSIETK